MDNVSHTPQTCLQQWTVEQLTLRPYLKVLQTPELGTLLDYICTCLCYLPSWSPIRTSCTYSLNSNFFWQREGLRQFATLCTVNSFSHSELSMLTILHESQVSRAWGKSWRTAKSRAKGSEWGGEEIKKFQKKKGAKTSAMSCLQLIKYSPVLSKDYQGVICASLGLWFS